MNDARVYGALSELSLARRVVTIGNFDGVHRGHQYLIRQVIDDARRRDARSTIVTFEPHPTSVLRPDVPFTRLTTPERKLDLLRRSGADDVLVLPFTRDFAATEPDAFLDDLYASAAPAAVFVGEGFRFGRDRSGDGATIEAHGESHGYDASVIPRLHENGGIISSSAIRGALARGDIASANAWLGRRYRLGGEVEHGAARGRELGFPTANLMLDQLACLPADGIYAGFAHVLDGDVPPKAALVYVGTRPTFSGVDRVLEACLLDFSGDLYTREVEVEFVAFIRADATFESAEALARQMAADEAAARDVLAAERPSNESTMA